MLKLGSQLLGFERLCQVVVHAGFETAFAISGERIRGQCDDRNLVRDFTCGDMPADFTRGCEAIHFWHLAIHQDQVEAATLQGCERLVAVGCDIAGAAAIFEQLGGVNLIDAVVFGDQHMAGQPGRRGCVWC